LCTIAKETPRLSWIFSLIHYALLFVLAIACSLNAQRNSTHAQSTATAQTDVAQPASNVQLKGLITDRKKYSITVNQNGIDYLVRLPNRTPVGLKMNKPWFDWENQQVVVDTMALGVERDFKNSQAKPAKRTAIELPAKNLHVISRLGSERLVKKFQDSDIKRLNFYLVSPDDLGQHSPTAEEPYLSGPLKIKDDQAHVEVDGQNLPVTFGIRYATMNGFSITDLKPHTTEVFLSGTWDDGKNEIVATRILFQPVLDTRTTPPS
jgi:hypothetical protein